MRPRSWSALFFAGLLCAPFLAAQARAIDTEKSKLTVRVEKAGVFSALGHDHEIGAAIASGSVDVAGSKVNLSVNAAALRVLDPGTAEKDRAEIQETMLGPEVLDAKRYSEIAFKSTRAESAGAGAWAVTGDLTLHGQTHPVTVEVREQNGHYTGTARFKQTEFGMKPVKVAGGAVRVKDEIRIEFDIQVKPVRGG